MSRDTDDNAMYDRMEASLEITLQSVSLVMQMEAMLAVEGPATKAFPHVVNAMRAAGCEQRMEAALAKAGTMMTECRLKALKDCGWWSGRNEPQGTPDPQ